MNQGVAPKLAPISILVADDHPIIRIGLKDLIEDTPWLTLVGQACDGRQAISEYFRLRPQVLLLDLNMPEQSGLQVIAEIRRVDPSARIIILTSYDDEEDIYQGLAAGAKAYLLKDAPCVLLLECIRVVAEGRKFVPSDVAAKLAGRFDSNQLSSREHEILQLVAIGKSNKRIARELGITEGTAKFHLNNIFGKLSAHSRTEAVNLAVRRGLVKF
jgi:two-component system NarL family response regulator